MKWDLPLSVNVDGKEVPIRGGCDFRIVLDVISALNDEELSDGDRIRCALFIFYEGAESIEDCETAFVEMLTIINGGKPCASNGKDFAPKVVDWEHDFSQIAPPVSRILGYDVRTPGKYTHWYSFLGAFSEIGDCTFSTVVSIRTKMASGKKLEKWEEEFKRNNQNLVMLPKTLSEEEEEYLSLEF